MNFYCYPLLFVLLAASVTCLCPTLKDPVCAENGKIYDNMCLLRLAGVSPAKDTSACENVDSPLSNGKPNCQRFCTREYIPVCGSNKLIYNNLCEMQRITCGQNVKSVPMEECQKGGPQ